LAPLPRCSLASEATRVTHRRRRQRTHMFKQRLTCTHACAHAVLLCERSVSSVGSFLRGRSLHIGMLPEECVCVCVCVCVIFCRGISLAVMCAGLILCPSSASLDVFIFWSHLVKLKAYASTTAVRGFMHCVHKASLSGHTHTHTHTHIHTLTHSTLVLTCWKHFFNF